MWETKLEPYLVIYNVGRSACEKGEQWHQALSMLGEILMGGQPLSATALGSTRVKMADSGRCN